MAQSSYQLITLNSNIVLSWPFSYSGTTIVADINDVNPILIPLDACYAATTENLIATYNNSNGTLTNSGVQTAFSIDTTDPVENARILVKDQIATFQNGIYTLTTIGSDDTNWVLTRSTDQMVIADWVSVTDGATNVGNWVETAIVTTIGTSPIIFAKQNGIWTITLPNANLANLGQNIIFNNISAYSFQILANDGITVLATVNNGQVFEMYLYDNSTSNGGWRVIPYGAGMNGVTSFTAQSADNSIAITNGTVTPPGGTINFQLPPSIESLNLLNNANTSNGFSIITGNSPLTWQTVQLQAGSNNITVSNSNGVNGNPTIDLASVIDGLTSLAAGNISISGSVITPSTPNGGIQLNSNGNGTAQINGVVIDANSNVTANNLTVNGTFSNPLVPVAWCVFTDTITGSANTIMHNIDIQNSVNIASITAGNPGIYTINFANALATENYGVLISLSLPSVEVSPLQVSYGFSLIKETTSTQIVIVDGSGEFVSNGIPTPATITIFYAPE